MAKYKARVWQGRDDATPTVTNDLTVLATAQTTSTFTMTPTRVDTGTAGTATGAITADASDATMATNIQAAIRALGGIYATATVAAGTTDTWGITVLGGYDITWATTATGPTITESGSAGGFTAAPGGVAYNGFIPVGRFFIPKRVRIVGWNDNSLPVAVTDAASKTVFSATVDTSTTGPADLPYDKYLTADGVAGEDGAAAANVSSGIFEGPLAVTVTTSAPIAARGLTPYVMFIGNMGSRNGGLKFRSTGAFTTATQDLYLGSEFSNIKRIKLKASLDTSVAPVITDGYGKNIYTKSSTDYTTAVDAQLSHEGVDQAGNAVADLCDVVAQGPVLVTLTGLGSGTFQVDFWVET